MKALAVLVVALYGLAMVHCDLEQVPGLEFLSSCHTQEGNTNQEQDCGTDQCSIVETGLYKVEEHASVVPAPLWVLSLVLPPWEATPPAATPRLMSLSDIPPEFPRIWQFSHRAALLPRAPSLTA